MPHRIPPPWGRHYPPSQIAALVRLLQAEGVSAAAALAGTGLDAAALDDVACRTSVAQLLAACRNALALSASAPLAFRLGSALHLPDHGTYGQMLLACDSVPDYFRLAEQYQGLWACALTLEAQPSGTGAVWIVADMAVRELPQALRTFLVEHQFAQLQTRLRDLLGPDCHPALACFAHAAPAHAALYTDHLQCPCVFGWHRNELRYDADVLARRPRLANAFTQAALQSACDSLLADMAPGPGFAGKVHLALRRLPDPGAGMKAVASALKMTDRTLRRRLACEGTSFSDIADQVRCSMARQHLQRPGASIEQVAALTGFSDPANFRRAFLRWTGMTPAQFRQRQLAVRAPLVEAARRMPGSAHGAGRADVLASSMNAFR